MRATRATRLEGTPRPQRAARYGAFQQRQQLGVQRTQARRRSAAGTAAFVEIREAHLDVNAAAMRVDSLTEEARLGLTDSGG